MLDKILFMVTISLLAGELTPCLGQEKAGTGELKAETAASGVKHREEPGKVVARMVEQLRRAPARPSLAEGRVGLYVISSAGGDATLIAGEPEAWLCQCGSPTWSQDGGQIAFDATPGGADFSMSRIKVLSLNEGRVELKDLGPGNCPSFSPSNHRLVFLLNPGAIPDATSGVWLTGDDGTGRTLLGAYGRPSWSTDSRRFMISSFGNPCDLTVIDAREGRGGDVLIDGKRIFSVPNWVGGETIVAAIGDTEGEDIALVDVSHPGQAAIKEVLWKSTGSEIKPYSPAYSAATGRCVFIGKVEGKGRALYVIERGRKGEAKRLESGGYDNLIQDPTMSPDGAYLVFASDRNPDLKAKGVRMASIEAPAISGIIIDGDLKDWPPAMERHVIGNLHTFPTANGHGGLENGFMSTSTDLSAAMSVGWDPKAQVVYVGVVVRDDLLVVGNTSPWDTDSIEIYVDGLRSDKKLPFPQIPDFDHVFDVADSPLLQYIGLPGKGPVYGVTKSAGVERGGDDNPILMWGDIKKTKTRMAFKRNGDVTTYEWAIQVFDHYPDQGTKLMPGLKIGFDVVILDKDAPATSPRAMNEPEGDRAAWISWGNSLSSSLRPLDASCLGELVLGRIPAH